MDFHTSTWFPTYWKWLGLPVSEFKGYLTDLVSWSFTELLALFSILFFGVSLTVIIVTLLLHFSKKLRPRLRPEWISNAIVKGAVVGLIVNPVGWVLAFSGQGALPFHSAPTAWRTSIHHWIFPDSVPSSKVDSLASHWQNLLLNEFPWTEYQSLSESELLRECNAQFDTLLSNMQLPPGRTVRRIKTMSGIIRLFGLSYGGPAFHSPLTSEMGMVSYDDYPTPKYWRYHAICHEIAHAKGFAREIDAELLTQFLFLTHERPLYRHMGYIMFLGKLGKPWKLPDSLKQEVLQTKKLRKIVREQQYWIKTLTQLQKSIALQNSSGKYGRRSKDQPWEGGHPYFSTVLHFLAHSAPFNPTDPK